MERPQLDLTEKVAVITGASKGIGRSIALTLAAAGAITIISSRRFEECKKVADEIIDSVDDGALGLGCQRIVTPGHLIPHFAKAVSRHEVESVG